MGRMRPCRQCSGDLALRGGIPVCSVCGMPHPVKDADGEPVPREYVAKVQTPQPAAHIAHQPAPASPPADVPVPEIAPVGATVAVAEPAPAQQQESRRGRRR